MGIAGLTGFFASIANNFRNHYLDLAANIRQNRTPDYYKSSSTSCNTDTSGAQSVAQDEYLPSTETTPETGSGTPATTADEQASTPVKQTPDGTYSYERRAQLDYQLDLRFDLTAVTRTVERLADGDVEAVDDFAAVNFGLTTDFDVDGYQRVTIRDDSISDTGNSYESQAATQYNSKAMAYQDRSFALNAFYDEALDIRSSMNETTGQSYRRAVNKFSLRYRLDNQFSVSLAERFNSQTERMLAQTPETVKSYADTAGELATTASDDLMVSFFDTVDSYLDDSEQAIYDKVTQFFDKAAAELGFSGILVDKARNQLTSTIEEFFGRVDTSLSQLESKFTSSDTAQALTAMNVAAPAVAEDSYQLATA